MSQSITYTKGLVSVVITTYNMERFIAETLDSVLAQTYTNLEIIVADDGSKDSTLEIVGRYAAADPRFKILRAEKNMGFSHNMNRGWGAVTGEFTAKLDADDLWFPDKIEKQVAFLNANPDYVFTHGVMEIFDSETGNTLRMSATADSLLRCPPVDHAFYTNWFFNRPTEAFIYSSVLARSEYLLAKKWDTRIPYHNEMLHLVEIYMLNPDGKWHGFTQPLGRYRYFSQSMSHSRFPPTFLMEEVYVKTAIACAVWPQLSRKAISHRRYFLFRQLLFDWVPADNRRYYRSQFLHDAGPLRFFYLLVCRIMLKAGILFPFFRLFGKIVNS